MMKLRFAPVLIASAALAPLAHGQEYPDKAIRIVVGFSAGTATDTMARIIGAKSLKAL